MSEEFKREERYLVVKISKLADDKGDNMSRSEQIFRIAHFGKALVNALVVEEDWPEYEPTWQMIERRMGGKPTVTAAEELEAVLHWRDKHAVAIKERDALQQRLNAADQRIDELTQRKAEPVEWGAPKTVRQLIRQLETLDQELRPLSMLRVPGDVFDDGKERTRAVHLSFSHERVDGQWLAPFSGDGEKVLAFWCRTEQPDTAFGFPVMVDPTLAPNEMRLVQPAPHRQEDAPIKGMIAARGGEFAIMIDEANAHYGWTFKKHPDGMWVSGRKATDAEMQAARQYARASNQQ